MVIPACRWNRRNFVAYATKFRWLSSDAAKPAVPPRVFLQRVEQLPFAEIRPEGRSDDQFGVGNLPEEEVAHPHFAARADEQIGVGIMLGVKMLREHLLVDLG